MNKKKKTSYPLTILLSTLSTAAPIVAVVWFLYQMIRLKNTAIIPLGGTFQVDDIRVPLISCIVFFITLVQWGIFKKPLAKMYQKAIQDNEYDEFGNSKKSNYATLTRKEREQMDKEKLQQMEMLFPTSVMNKIVKEGSRNPEKDLQDMIGLPLVKQKVTEMAARMQFEREAMTKEKQEKKQTRSEYGMNGRHFVFYGSAGTGKTTVARIITGFLYKYGYIKENKCSDRERRLSSFGNGRTARNILDECLDRHALNYGQNLLSRKITVNGEEQIITDKAQNKFVLCGCDVSTSPNKNVL